MANAVKRYVPPKFRKPFHETSKMDWNKRGWKFQLVEDIEVTAFFIPRSKLFSETNSCNAGKPSVGCSLLRLMLGRVSQGLNSQKRTNKFRSGKSFLALNLIWYRISSPTLSNRLNRLYRFNAVVWYLSSTATACLVTAAISCHEAPGRRRLERTRMPALMIEDFSKAEPRWFHRNMPKMTDRGVKVLEKLHR